MNSSILSLLLLIKNSKYHDNRVYSDFLKCEICISCKSYALVLQKVPESIVYGQMSWSEMSELRQVIRNKVNVKDSS